MTHARDVTKGADGFVSAIGNRLDGTPLALMLDIDGTLAPIAPTPADAAVPAATREALRRLIARPATVVALISGRSATDALHVAGVEGAWIIGNHGLELRTPRGDLSAISEARPFETSIGEAARMLAPLERSVRGVIVENKRWTLSVHYRLVAPGDVPDVLDGAREVARALGLRVTEGKRIIELRPPIPINKGTAAVAFGERVGALGPDGSALYAGDDRTDEDAFEALRARSPRAVTVRIMAAADEPLNARTHAEIVLASPDELRQVLERLAARTARPVVSA